MNLKIVSTVLALASTALTVEAAPIQINVDAAPNMFGSPNYAPWWANAQSAAANGTFVNMANSFNPANAGTTNFEIEDVVVYSFGDLGRRLHFVYWVEGETKASLLAKNFQVALDFDWEGVTYDAYDYYYGSTWQTPSNLFDYDDGVNQGVIGTTGWAWWGAYGVNTQAALEADLAAWSPAVGDITLHARMDGTSGFETASLTVVRAPEAGATVALLGLGMLALGAVRSRQNRE